MGWDWIDFVKDEEFSSKKNTEEFYQLLKHMVFLQGTFKIHEVSKHLAMVLD